MLKNGKLFRLFIGSFIVSQILYFGVVVPSVNKLKNDTIEEVKTIGGNIVLDGNKKTRVKIIEVINNPIQSFYIETGDTVYLLEDNSYITVHKDNTVSFYSVGDMEEYYYDNVADMLQDIHFIPYFEII